MKKILLALVFLLLAASAGAQNSVTVSASSIHDSAGTVLASGSILFAPVDSTGKPISYQAGGGGQVINWPVTFPITSGAFSGSLANGAFTNPANVCFLVTVKNANNVVVMGGAVANSGYRCVQTATNNFWCTSAVCNFDTYFPQANGIPLFPLPPPTLSRLGGVYSTACTGSAVVQGYNTSGQPVCVTPTGAGTITGVTAGTGLQGGGSTGSVTLSLLATIASNTSGNAATATALAAVPTLCSAGQAPTGVLANGNATGCASIGGTQVYPLGTGITVVSGGSSWGTTLAAPSGAIVGTSDTQTLTNKTLDGVTPTIMGYLDATSSIQTQLNGKVSTATTVNGKALSGNITLAFSDFAAGALPAGTTISGYVANTTTVNGHALSSNVVVSASDITTGTLPHAQLPTLLSGDIPNNAANTSGNAATATALAAVPSQCTGGQFATGIAANGSANCATPTGAGNVSNSGTPTLGQLAVWVNATQIQGVNTLPTAAVPAFTGDVTNSAGSLATTVGKVNGLAIPTSAALIATNGSSQFTALTVLPTSAEPAHTGDATNSAGSLAMTVKGINGVALSGLATGILKNTTATGTPSIAVVADFPTLNQSTTGNAATATAFATTPSQCSGTQFSQGVTASGNSNCATPTGSGTVNTASQYSLPYYSAAGTAATISGVAAPTANGVYQMIYNVTANVAVAPTLVLPGVPVNPQSGTSYTYLYSDRESYTSFTNASAVAATLPAAGGTGFTSNWANVSCNQGAGTVTITPTTSTISFSTGSAFTSGASSMTLTTGQCAWIYSDNTNYFAIRR